MAWRILTPTLQYARALMELGRVAHSQNCIDEALVWFQRAEEALEGLVHDSRYLDLIVFIDGQRRTIASVFGRSGLEGPRRRLLEMHLRELERLSELGGGDSAIELLATLVRLELAPDADASTKLRAAIQNFPPNERIPLLSQGSLADWIASDVQTYPFRTNPNGEWKGCLDPDAHARAVIRRLESWCEALGVDDLLPCAAIQVAGMAAGRGAEQRKAHRLDDARQTAACLSAFARTLVQRDPDQAAFHMALCIAFEQESKNAWQVHDYTAIEDALRKALSEAFTALHLDPRNSNARLNVASLQEKLVGLISERRKPDEGN